MNSNSVLVLAAFVASAPWIALVWSANRHTSLTHAVAWAMAAWLAWAFGSAAEPVGSPPGPALYVALALAGCAAIAVLGARRPGVLAWNAVVAALLAVLLLPLAESVLRGGDFRLDALRLIALGGTLTIAVLNYLPTGFVLVALLFGVGWGCEWLRFARPEDAANPELDVIGRVAVAAAPWGWLILLPFRRKRNRSVLDATWIGFRERFGVVWSQRLREQFNHAARHAGWPVVLMWRGLRAMPGNAGMDAARVREMEEALVALMKRFGSSVPDA